jgi:hypothetical protein
MAKSKRKKSQTETTNELIQFVRKCDLSVLGDSILSLPPTQWHKNMFFAGAPDIELKQLTGNFPATFRKDKDTHPLFVIESMQIGNYVCPCSTKGNARTLRYIKARCQLLDGRREMTENTSFLVENYSFTLPADKRFSRKLIYVGLVPAQCIRDERRKP